MQILVVRVSGKLVRQVVDDLLGRVAFFFGVARRKAHFAVSVAHLILCLLIGFLGAVEAQLCLVEGLLGLDELAVHAVVDVGAGVVVVLLGLLQRAQSALGGAAGAVDRRVQAVIEIVDRVPVLFLARGEILRGAVLRDGKRKPLFFERILKRAAVELAQDVPGLHGIADFDVDVLDDAAVHQRVHVGGGGAFDGAGGSHGALERGGLKRQAGGGNRRGGLARGGNRLQYGETARQHQHAQQDGRYPLFVFLHVGNPLSFPRGAGTFHRKRSGTGVEFPLRFRPVLFLL